MFSIYLNGPRESPDSVLIYNDLILDEEYQLINPLLIKEDNATGSMEFEVPMHNIAYNLIQLYNKDSDIYVYKKGFFNEYGLDGTDDVYWSGRIFNVTRGIENHKLVYCEGALGFLNDTIQTPGIYETITSDNDSDRSLHTYLYYLLERHNSKVNDNRKIYLGETTVVFSPTKWYTNFEKTLDVLKDIASSTSGHLRIRRSVRNGKSAWVLDLLNDDIWEEGKKDSNNITMTSENKWRYIWIPNNGQDIEYGINLLDITQDLDLSTVVTVLYPLGKRKNESTIEGVDEYYTIDSGSIPEKFRAYVRKRQDSTGYYYLESSLADKLGHLEASINYDDVTEADELIKLGILDLTLENSILYNVDASVIDLSYKDSSIKPIDLYDIILVYAAPHEIVEMLKVSKCEIPLDNPVDGKFIIGGARNRTFTELTTSGNKSMANKIKYLSIKPYVAPTPPAPSENLGE